MKGSGKYENEIAKLRKKLNAEGILLLVVNGDRGSGFGVQIIPEHMNDLPIVLRAVACDLENQNGEWKKNLKIEQE